MPSGKCGGNFAADLQIGAHYLASANTLLYAAKAWLDLTKGLQSYGHLRKAVQVTMTTPTTQDMPTDSLKQAYYIWEQQAKHWHRQFDLKSSWKAHLLVTAHGWSIKKALRYRSNTPLLSFSTNGLLCTMDCSCIRLCYCSSSSGSLPVACKSSGSCSASSEYE